MAPVMALVKAPVMALVKVPALEAVSVDSWVEQALAKASVCLARMRALGQVLAEV
jgi:hypothetical protein